MSIEVSSQYPTEYDSTTEVLIYTLTEAGVSQEEVMFVQQIMLPELVLGRMRVSESEEDFGEHIVPALDLLFLGLLVREYMPRDVGMMGYRTEADPTDAALRGAVTTAHEAGASEADLQAAGTDVFRMLAAVGKDKLTTPAGLALALDLLKIMLIGMILHRHVPATEDGN